MLAPDSLAAARCAVLLRRQISRKPRCTSDRKQYSDTTGVSIYEVVAGKVPEERQVTVLRPHTAAQACPGLLRNDEASSYKVTKGL